MTTVLMQAPSGIATFTSKLGTSYAVPSTGLVSVTTGSDVADALQAGFTYAVATSQNAANFRNLIDGGDFTTNPWQRNIAGLASSNVIASAISNTVTYFPDRFFAVGGASSSILLSQVADTNVAGFSQSCKLQRSSANANTAVINFGQVLETLDSVKAQGQTVCLSFWARSGANYSGGAMTVQLIQGTGTNQSAANMVAASWTNQANVINTTQALTTTMTRYSFTGLVGTAATQLGVLFSFTPAGTAGADDSIVFNGIQLEVGGTPSAFEHRDIQVELEIAQRYAWIVAEPASGVVVGVGANTATNTQVWYLATPVQMLKAPTVTRSAGTFVGNSSGNAAASATITAGTTHTPNAISIGGTATGTAGYGNLLQGGGGTGYIVASADF